MSHAIVAPERIGVDECSRHPRLMVGEPNRLEGRVRDTQRRFAETLRATGLKAETRVIARVALEEHDRHAAFDHHLKARTDQHRPDPLSLMFGQHPDRTEYLHVDEPARSV